MSENNTETATTDTEPPAVDPNALAQALTGQHTATHQGQGDTADAEVESPNREAARWRTKLRDTEAERDSLAARLEAMQRAAVDSHATAAGIQPRALWASGVQLADLIDDNGVPDVEKVNAAVESAKNELGLAVHRPRPPVPFSAMKSGAMAAPPKRDRWVEAFGPRDRG